MVACYFELYEEGEVEHINGPTHPSQQQRFAFLVCSVLQPRVSKFKAQGLASAPRPSTL